MRSQILKRKRKKKTTKRHKKILFQAVFLHKKVKKTLKIIITFKKKKMNIISEALNKVFLFQKDN